MNALLEYEDEDDTEYKLSEFYSPMFTQVTTVSPINESIDCRRTQHLFNQQNMTIPETALLLDNESTVNYICNPDLVYNIRKVQHCCIVATNTGQTLTCYKASLRPEIMPLKEEVWFDPNGIANIVALHIVQAQFNVNYSNWSGP